jgi:hypothetical protein
MMKVMVKVIFMLTSVDSAADFYYCAVVLVTGPRLFGHLMPLYPFL